MTTQQLLVLRLTLQGNTVDQTALALRLARRTVHRRLAETREALGASTRAEMLATARALGMFDLTVFDHVPDSDRGVSWDQHLYLSAFDRHLHAGDDERRLERVKLLTDAALEGIGRKPGRSVPAREWMIELLLEDMGRAS